MTQAVVPIGKREYPAGVTAEQRAAINSLAEQPKAYSCYLEVLGEMNAAVQDNLLHYWRIGHSVVKLRQDQGNVYTRLLAHAVDMDESHLAKVIMFAEWMTSEDEVRKLDPRVTFEHIRCLVSRDAGQRQRLLDKVVKEGWSTVRLRAEIDRLRGIVPSSPNAPSPRGLLGNLTNARTQTSEVARLLERRFDGSVLDVLEKKIDAGDPYVDEHVGSALAEAQEDFRHLRDELTRRIDRLDTVIDKLKVPPDVHAAASPSANGRQRRPG